jgi:quercetin dioxygenase-like cupin family protein
MNPKTLAPDQATMHPVRNKPFKSDRSTVEVFNVGRGMMRGVKAIFHAEGKNTGNALGVLEIEWPAGDVTAPHIHWLEDEGFYVLDGELTLYVPGHGELVLTKGQFGWAPRGLPHYYAVTGDAGAKVLVLEVPGGTLTEFFRGVAAGQGAEIDDDADLIEFAEWTEGNFGVHFLTPDEVEAISPPEGLKHL